MTERAASSPRGTGSLADALARVPRELKIEPRWVCWRREERNGRATKLPVDARTGRMMRQRNSRLCRKYGLKGRRERKK